VQPENLQLSLGVLIGMGVSISLLIIGVANFPFTSRYCSNVFILVFCWVSSFSLVLGLLASVASR
jgi:hypothetical protein